MVPSFDGGVPVYPRQVIPRGLTGLKGISGGYNVGLAIDTNGVAVGLNFTEGSPDGIGDPIPWPDLPYGIPLTNILAIAASADLTDVDNLALKADGTVVEWRLGSVSPAPAGLRDVTAIAVGSGSYLALKRDGTVYGWGKNEFGQATGIPREEEPYVSSGLITLGGSALSNVVAIAAGANRFSDISSICMALKRDGTVVTWGRFGQLHPGRTPDGLRGVIAIAAGGGGDDRCR